MTAPPRGEHPFETALVEHLAELDHTRWGATPWSEVSEEDKAALRDEARRTLAAIATLEARYVSRVPPGARLATLLTVDLALPIHGPTTTTWLVGDLMATLRAWARRRGVVVVGQTSHHE